jgi:two-component system LytT family sensor kinase
MINYYSDLIMIISTTDLTILISIIIDVYLITLFFNAAAKNRKNEDEIERQMREILLLRGQILSIKKNQRRAQLNAHFIFNALNYIKFAIKKNSSYADEAICRLSSLIRFAVDNVDEKNQLKHELDQIENLIILNQLRFDNKIQMVYEKDISNENVDLISLCIISLVENIFKHGNLFEKKHPVRLMIKCNNEFFQYRSSNLVNYNVLQNTTEIGMENLKERLNLIYPGNSEFRYGTVGNIYYVDLKIRLVNNID